jgi:hypothetical protein
VASWAHTRIEGRPGQASVELLALIPALVIAVLIAGQAVAAGWALWTAADAARAGARAEHIGADGEAAARRALPGILGHEAEVSSGDGVRVSVRVPALLPGVSMPAVSAGAKLDAGR